MKVNGLVDKDTEAAHRSDKVHSKKEEGIKCTMSEASATLPRGDTATKQVWPVITVIQDADSRSTESAGYDPSSLL